ncbi:MAG: RsmE family RNA methyltransferase [Alphaproteobacteria bacterium]|nr:RsmE family RNA methyltransferase [Alphaproteobacteria bacterium]
MSRTRLHRFYYPLRCATGDTFSIHDEHIVHQWNSVLRYKKEDRVIVFGIGYEYTCTIITITKKSVQVLCVEQASSKKRNIQFTLACGIPKKNVFEQILSQAVEIGVNKIMPVMSERSQRYVLDSHRNEKIITEAVEQSGWGDMAVCLEVQSFHTLCDTYGDAMILFTPSKEIEQVGSLYTKELNFFLGDIVIAIGPEGGWSDDETAYAKKKGARIVSIPCGVLRTETAVIACCMYMLYYFQMGTDNVEC